MSTNPLFVTMKCENEYDEEELLVMKAGGRFSDLPTDIFFDILSRLPLKSLSQCRWVSKTWFSLIYRPRFAELHYSREVHDRCSPSIVLATYSKQFYLLDYQLFDHFGTSTTPIEIEFKGFDDVFSSKGFKRLFQVVGCVNGLICFSSDPDIYGADPYYIVNPITGDHVVLPKSPKCKIAPAVSQFGFDPATRQYKVIRILQDQKDVAKPVEAEIFTLGSNTWRKIENIPYVTHRVPNNVLVNGNLHWVSHQNIKDIQDLVIVSFSVGNEEIDLIEPPPCLTRRNHNTFETLCVFEGSLCLINAYYDSDLAGTDTEMCQIWVMEDYGVQSSWVKKHVVSIQGREWCNYRELIKLQNDLILLKLDEELGYYNLKDNVFRPIKIHHMPAMHFGIPPMIQYGSLFSPKDAHELKKSKHC